MRLHGRALQVIAQPRSWLRAVILRNHLEEDMEAELAHHLESLTIDLIRAGQQPAEAARNARIALGSFATAKEGMRFSLNLRWWDELWSDLRYGVRILRKSPGFAAIATTSLALAIGANTSIYSVAKQVLYGRLNVPNPGELQLLQWVGDKNSTARIIWGSAENREGGGEISPSFSYPVYRELRAHNRVMEDLFAFKSDWMNATVSGSAQRLRVEMVSGNYYTQLGIHPQYGRTIQETDDDAEGVRRVAVISDALWQRAFDRSPSAVGQTIKLNDAETVIVGINPPGFTGTGNALTSPDVFVPLSMQPLLHPAPTRTISTESSGADLRNNPDFWWVGVMGREKRGVESRVAQAALDVQFSAAVRGSLVVKQDESVPHLELVSGARGLHDADWMFKKPVNLLMALVGLVLVLACANIANLLLARCAQRQREMSVRLALGAGRRRILKQLLVESLLLSAIGGAGGLALGYLGRNTIPQLLSHGFQRDKLSISFDWQVFIFAAAVTVGTGILFGLAPAWMSARAEVSGSLKENSQTVTRRRSGMGGKGIVVFQIALSTLLVVGAGLFLRTLLTLNAVDVGFNPDNLLLFEINLPSARYPAGKSVQMLSRLEQNFAEAPGVERVASALSPYIASSMSSVRFLPEGEASTQQKQQVEYFNLVGTNFFQTLEIPMIAGRAFGSEDTATSEKVGIINESLARKRFPNVNPIGKRFRVPNLLKNDLVRIVGICSDTHYERLQGNPPPQFILPFVQQNEMNGMTFIVRSRLAPGVLAHTLRQIVQQADRDLPVIDIRTQREQINESIQMQRTIAALTCAFGFLALALACVGIYGVMAFSVAQRRNEIGIRLALGAQPGQVCGMVLGESAFLAATGIVVGVAAALCLTRLVKSMLYGIQPWDPTTLTGGVLTLLIVALAASWAPARRAARVQPMETLRHE
jgi:Acidobacterial duplicated orphan permease